MIPDLSPWITGDADWPILFVSALLIGMSKTGIQGISMLAIPLMAITFGAKPSTGLILPMLCFADLVAVFYYRRQAEWKYIFKLLPAALAGFGVALLVDTFIPPQQFRTLMGICILFVMGVMLANEKGGKYIEVTNKWWYGPLFGLLGGFTTMIGNAAGPVMAVYLLSMKLPKYSFMGTSAWFFLVINYLKLPLQVFAWNNINTASLFFGSGIHSFYFSRYFIGYLVCKKTTGKELPAFYYCYYPLLGPLASSIKMSLYQKIYFT